MANLNFDTSVTDWTTNSGSATAVPNSIPKTQFESMLAALTPQSDFFDRSIVVNESGLDYDFRVESSTNANALVVDGGTGNVGIAGSADTGNYDLRVNGQLKVINSTGSTECYVESSTDTSIVHVKSTYATGYGQLYAEGGGGARVDLQDNNPTGSNDRFTIINAGDKIAFDMYDTSDAKQFDFFELDATDGNVAIGGTTDANYQLKVVGDTWVYGKLSIGTNNTDNPYFRSYANSGSQAATDIVSATNLGGTLTACTEAGLLLSGDPAGHIVAAIRANDTNDSFTIAVPDNVDDNTEYNPACDKSVFRATYNSVTVNPSGRNVDFRVESDTIDHALVVEGQSGKVGIGGPVSPSSYELKVHGNTYISNDSPAGNGTELLITDHKSTAAVSIISTAVDDPGGAALSLRTEDGADAEIFLATDTVSIPVTGANVLTAGVKYVVRLVGSTSVADWKAMGAVGYAINNSGGYSAGTGITMTVTPATAYLSAGQKIYFSGGAEFTATTSFAVGATSITGDLDASVADGEEVVPREEIFTATNATVTGTGTATRAWQAINLRNHGTATELRSYGSYDTANGHNSISKPIWTAYHDGASGNDGGFIINENAKDHDFRVESSGNANMLFVDGGNDAVSIGSDQYWKFLAEGWTFAGDYSASTDTITLSARVSSSSPAAMPTDGTQLRFKAKGGATMPGGLSESTTYYVINSNSTNSTFKVSPTEGGSAENISSDTNALLADQQAIQIYHRTPVEVADANQSLRVHGDMLITSSDDGTQSGAELTVIDHWNAAKIKLYGSTPEGQSPAIIDLQDATNTMYPYQACRMNVSDGNMKWQSIDNGGEAVLSTSMSLYPAREPNTSSTRGGSSQGETQMKTNSQLVVGGSQSGDPAYRQVGTHPATMVITNEQTNLYNDSSNASGVIPSHCGLVIENVNPFTTNNDGRSNANLVITGRGQNTVQWYDRDAMDPVIGGGTGQTATAGTDSAAFNMTQTGNNLSIDGVICARPGATTSTVLVAGAGQDAVGAVYDQVTQKLWHADMKSGMVQHKCMNTATDYNTAANYTGGESLAGAVHSGSNWAPIDANIHRNCVVFYVDGSNGLKARYKDDAGTLSTFTLS
jgi:hypothetical protein